MNSKVIKGYEIDTIELKKLMIDNHLDSIDALSEKSGVNRNTVADTVNGRAYPSTMVMHKIAMTLHMDSHIAGKIFFKEKLA